MAMAAMSFLECVEVCDDFLPEARSGKGFCAWHSPRISFSNEFAQEQHKESQQESSLSPSSQAKNQNQSPCSSRSSSFNHHPSSSGEFEFSNSMNSAAAQESSPTRNHPPMLSADELFYKGKLLPLHLPPRIQMVQDLSIAKNHPDPQQCLDQRAESSRTAARAQEQQEIDEEHEEQHQICENKRSGMRFINRSPMRRERSLRSPARQSMVASTLKSSSYPPPGYSSRPSSRPSSPPGKNSNAKSCGSSRWRDLFGLKKSVQSPKAAGSPSGTGASSSSSSSGFLSKQAVPSKLLKMIFNRGSNSHSNLGSSNSEHHNFDHQEPATNNNNIPEALLPLLRDSSCSSSEMHLVHQQNHQNHQHYHHRQQIHNQNQNNQNQNHQQHSEIMSHSSSNSSNSSSNWAASSASSSTASSSSFSADFPEISSTSEPISCAIARKSDATVPMKLGNSRNRGGIANSPGRARRFHHHNRAAAIGPISSAGSCSSQAGKNLQRCGSYRKASSCSSSSSAGSSSGRMQLQDHVLIGRMRENSWRRPDHHHHNHHKTNSGAPNCSSSSSAGSNSSSCRVTPVLHVPACIGPSLRSVRVHGFRRLFSSSSSSSSSTSAGSGKAHGVVVM